MEDFCWSTDYYLGTNEDNMEDFIENHMYLFFSDDFEITSHNGTQIEVYNASDGDFWIVDVCGDGDSYSHRAKFTQQ